MREIDKRLVQRADLPTVTDEAAWRAYQEHALQRLRDSTFRYTLSQNVPHLRELRADGGEGDRTYATRVFDSYDGMTVAHQDEAADEHLSGRCPRSYSRYNRMRAAPSPAADRTSLASVVSSPRPLSRCGTREPRPWVPAISGRRGAPIRCWGKRFPSDRCATCWQRFRCCGRRRRPALWPCTAKTTRDRWPFMQRLLDPQIAEIVLAECPESHEDPHTPEFLGVLRIGDLPAQPGTRLSATDHVRGQACRRPTPGLGSCTRSSVPATVFA